VDKIVSPKELKKVKQEKESLIAQLSKSHVLIDSLRSENTVLFDIIDIIENKLKEFEDLLKEFSSDNLKSMLCIHSDISNKPALIVDDMSTSTSHASDSELDSIDIKPVIVNTACLENSCLNNHVMPKSKEHEVSLFILVIIMGKLVILGQIAICCNPTGLGLNKML
jgi:hypothetical protein